MTTRQRIDDMGGKRFLLTLLSGIAATTLQWFGKLDPAGTSYAILIGATVAAFITGDTTEKVKAPK